MNDASEGKEQINFYAEPGLKAKLKSKVSAERKTLSEVLEGLVRQYLGGTIVLAPAPTADGETVSVSKGNADVLRAMARILDTEHKDPQVQAIKLALRAVASSKKKAG